MYWWYRILAVVQTHNGLAMTPRWLPTFRTLQEKLTREMKSFSLSLLAVLFMSPFLSFSPFLVQRRIKDRDIRSTPDTFFWEIYQEARESCDPIFLLTWKEKFETDKRFSTVPRWQFNLMQVRIISNRMYVLSWELVSSADQREQHFL